MIDSYITIKSCGQGEVIEKKSRFIAYVESVETEEDAYAFVESIKKKHYDARHNCFAFSVGVNMPLLRFSDDGEPQGTAGKPILEVINNSQICNICIVVTRYFGGTLLGTGGLVRAYTEASKEAINDCITRIVQRLNIVNIDMNYTDLGKVQFILNNNQLEILDTIYKEDVRIIVYIPYNLTPTIKKEVTEVTSARAIISIEDEIFG